MEGHDVDWEETSLRSLSGAQIWKDEWVEGENNILDQATVCTSGDFRH